MTVSLWVADSLPGQPVRDLHEQVEARKQQGQLLQHTAGQGSRVMMAQNVKLLRLPASDMTARLASKAAKE